MTIRLEGTTKRWVGLSVDDKPRPTSKSPGATEFDNQIPAGSSFLESDTGRIYRWNGFEWRAPEPDDLGTILRSIDERLARLVEITEAIAS